MRSCASTCGVLMMRLALRRGTTELASCLSPYHMRTQWEGNHLQDRKGTALSLAFHLPGLAEIPLCLLPTYSALFCFSSLSWIRPMVLKVECCSNKYLERWKWLFKWVMNRGWKSLKRIQILGVNLVRVRIMLLENVGKRNLIVKQQRTWRKSILVFCGRQSWPTKKLNF